MKFQEVLDHSDTFLPELAELCLSPLWSLQPSAAECCCWNPSVSFFSFFLLFITLTLADPVGLFRELLLDPEVSKRCCSSCSELLEFCDPVFLTFLSHGFSVGEKGCNICREMQNVNLFKKTLTNYWSVLRQLKKLLIIALCLVMTVSKIHPAVE